MRSLPQNPVAVQIICLLAAWSATTAPASDGPLESNTLVSTYINLAIQGDLRGAAELLSGAAARDDEAAADLLGQYLDRFGDQPGDGSPLAGDPATDQVIRGFQRYWKSRLLGANSSSADERTLQQDIADALAISDTAARTGEPFDDLREFLSHSGLFYFVGRSPPLQDLFLWKSQSLETYDVALSDGTVSLEVAFMDDFIVQGWKDFASLGLTTVTGWVENGRLYCIRWAYDTESENFDVSYLKHEARHLADLERYPDMDTIELEYRAKLTELAFARQTVPRILRDFTEKSAPNRESPHAMANYRVVQGIYQRIHGGAFPPDPDGAWRYTNTEQINRAALSLLKESDELQAPDGDAAGQASP